MGLKHGSVPPNKKNRQLVKNFGKKAPRCTLILNRKQTEFKSKLTSCANISLNLYKSL